MTRIHTVLVGSYAQPQLDLEATLNILPGKTILIGVLDLEMRPRNAAMIVNRLRKALVQGTAIVNAELSAG